MSELEFIRSEQTGAVRTLTLDRPKANAFNDQMIKELTQAFKAAGRDDSVRAIVLTGEGRVFSAGQDLARLAESPGEIPIRWHLQQTYNLLVPMMRDLGKPILGAINGPVAGAGLGTAMATDLRIAAQSAKFVFGFTGIGLTADCGTALTLPLLVGMTRAMEIALTNEPLTAERALEYGLINRVVADDELPEAAAEWAAELAAGPTRALGFTKRLFNYAWMANLESILDQEAYLQEVAGRTDDHKEGVQAFLAKRPSEFIGS